jgi:hypothetical protein
MRIASNVEPMLAASYMKIVHKNFGCDTQDEKRDGVFQALPDCDAVS